jgi:hypothetical protein
MPKVTKIELPVEAKMGIAVEGSAHAWPGSAEEPSLPQFDVFNRQQFYIDVFNCGQTSFTFTAIPTASWIVVSEAAGIVDQEKRIWVRVDWSNVPEGSSTGYLKIASKGAPDITVRLEAFRPAAPAREEFDGFVEGNGYVSMEAVHYTNKVDGSSARWEKIDDLGRTLSSMTSFPVTAASSLPDPDSPCLEYQMYLFHSGRIEVEAILSPTLNFVHGRGLRYAVSFDDETPQVEDVLAHDDKEKWETSVKDSVRKVRSTHEITKPGKHTLKIWRVDPGVVLQKLVIDLGGVKPSYLGPPESYHVHASEKTSDQN